jgi:hypothetical protein
MKENNSPLFRRRAARGISIEDAAFISSANRDRITEGIGQEVGGLGTALGEAFEKAKKRKDDRDSEAEAQIIKFDDFVKDSEGPSAEDLTKGLFTKGLVKEKPNNYKEYFKQEERQAKELGNQAINTFESLTEGEKGALLSKGVFDADSYAEYLKKKSGNVGFGTSRSEIDKFSDMSSILNYSGSLPQTPGITRLKDDDSPLERRRRRSYANELMNSFDNNPVKGSSDESQYEEGKTYVEKERMLSAPSWMGSAAVEGYNMSVQARNYERQVQADTEDYTNEQLKGLDVERTGYNFLDESLAEQAMVKKKEYAAHVAEREQWFREGRGSEWTIRKDEIRKFADNVLNGVDSVKGILAQYEEGLKNGTIDAKMTNPDFLELLNSIKSGNAPIGITDAGQGAAMYGATKNGTPVNMLLSQLPSQLSKMKLVEKKNPMVFYKEAQKDLLALVGDKETTIDANGNKITKYNTEGLNDLINVYLEEELRDPMNLKGYAGSVLGADHGSFQAEVDTGGDMKAKVRKKMNEQLTKLLKPTLGYRSEGVTGLSTLREQEKIRRIKESEVNEIKANEDQFDWESWSNSILIKTRGGSEGQMLGTDYNVSELNRIKGVSEAQKEGNTIKLFDKEGDLLKTIDFSNEKSGLKTLEGYAKSKGLLETGTNFDAKRFIENFNKNKSN